MKIGIVIGSVREGRLGERVASWVQKRLTAQSRIEVEVLDLKSYPLPFYDEAQEPSKIIGPYQSEVANKWVDKVAEMDGFVIIAPEYNHGYSAVLKNSLDYLSTQLNNKPAIFVSYSTGPIGGARAVEQLRQVVANLKLIVTGAIHIGKAQEVLSEHGDLLSGHYNEMLDKQLESVIK
jgi:NAD(P)H-dependent FMN reductase